MQIPRIQQPHFTGALRKLKNVCAQKQKTVKKALPGMLLLAESLTMPVQAPNAMKLMRTTAVTKPQELAKDVERTAEFLNIKGMIQRVVPDISDEFVTQILETAKKVKCSPEDLTALLYKESQFQPHAKNGSFGGIGQMNGNSLHVSINHAVKDETSKDGINTHLMIEKFFSLPREKQMPYVRNYILAMKSTYMKKSNKTMTGGELYGLFYTPGRINKNYLTSAKDSSTRKMYLANRQLDFDKDSTITTNDLQCVLNSVKSTDLNTHLAKK